MNNKLTQSYLKECLEYDPSTGKFMWLRRPVEHFKDQRSCNKWNTQRCGKTAGGPEGHGYWRIILDARQHPAHRLAHLYVMGFMPEQVDHINGDRGDNRWCNLRAVTNAENKRNQCVQSRSKSGHIGVYPSPTSGSWVAYITFDKKRQHIGTFSSLDEAVTARKAAERSLGFHPNHGAR